MLIRTQYMMDPFWYNRLETKSKGWQQYCSAIMSAPTHLCEPFCNRCDMSRDWLTVKVRQLGGFQIWTYKPSSSCQLQSLHQIMINRTIWSPWGHKIMINRTIGSPWGHQIMINRTIGSPWGHQIMINQTIGSPWGHQIMINWTIWSPWGHQIMINRTIGSPWGHQIMINWTIWSPWGHQIMINRTIGSPWGHQIMINRYRYTKCYSSDIFHF